jgi:hypothetical protein
MNLQYELFLAIQSENISLIENLIQRGANVNLYIDWKFFTKKSYLANSIFSGKYLDYAISKVLEPYNSCLLGTFNNSSYPKIFTKCTFDNVFSVLDVLVKYGASTAVIHDNYYIFSCISVIDSNQRKYVSNRLELASKRCLNCIKLFKYLLKTGISVNFKSIDSYDSTTITEYIFKLLDEFDYINFYNKTWFPNVIFNFCNLLLVNGYCLKSIKDLKAYFSNTKKLYNNFMEWPLLQIFYCFYKKNIFFIF